MVNTLSQEFQRLQRECDSKTLTVDELFTLIGSRAPATITLILSIPFLFLIPLPGISNLFGLIILFIGVCLSFNKPIWLPGFLKKKKVNGKHLAKAFAVGAKISKWIEKWIRPRGDFFHRHPLMRCFNGVVIAICGLILALPLPPGANFLPGLTCIFMSIGILEEDGVFITIGYFFFLVDLFVYLFLPIFGWR